MIYLHKGDGYRRSVSISLRKDQNGYVTQQEIGNGKTHPQALRAAKKELTRLLKLVDADIRAIK